MTESLHDLVVRGRDFLEAGDPSTASRLLAQAHEQVPQDRSVLADLARAYADSAQLSRAEAAFTRLVEADAADAWARAGLGRALLRRSRPDEALVHLRLAHAMTGDERTAADIERAQARLGSRTEPGRGR